MIKLRLTSSLWLTFGLGALVLLLGLVPALTEPLLQFDRARINSGEWWRLFTGQLIHYGIYHLAMNIAALLLCGYVLLRELTLGSYICLLLLSTLAVGIGLYFINPELDFYAGLSGVLHGLIVTGLILTFRETKIFNGVALMLVVGKLVQEQAADFDTSHALLPVPVAVDAHAYGACAGLLVGGIILALRHIKTTNNQPPKTNNN